jgi:hypothetical protein
MSILTKNELSASNQAAFPDNTNGDITPQILRDFNQGVIDTLVDSLNTGSYAIVTGSNSFTQANTFTSISASSFVSASLFVGDGSKITNITASVALPILDEGILQGYATSMNFTGSNINAQVIAGTAVVNVNTSNLITTSSFNPFTQSVNSFTQSQETKNSTLATYTASVDTKFVAVSNSTSSLNAYTASNDTKWSNLQTTTASIQNSITALNSYTSSDNSAITNLNAFTASQNTKNSTLATYTSSVDTKFSNIGSQSGSWVTESETGSFADINKSNTFTQANTFTSISASSFVSASQFVGDGSKLTNIPGATPLTSLNAYTASQDTKNTAVGAATASLNAYTASNDTKWSTLSTTTSSLFTSASLSLTTASVSLNTITFRKGDGTTFNVVVNTGSAVTTDITALNAFTASQLTINSAIGASTSSLNTFTSSANTQLTNLASSQSIDNTKWGTLGTQSGSWITSTQTGSFAYINQSNNWSANQTFTNISAVSASFQYVTTTYETSSVIYSSGSNQLGDATNDIQTLIGTVIVSGSQEITGSLRTTGTFTSSLATGYTWVGNGNNISTLVATSSFLDAVTLTSLNAYTASQDTKNATLATYTASVDTKFTTLGNLTGSYATTGSNTFIGNQIISGQLYVSNSVASDVVVEGQLFISSSTSGSTNQARLTISGAIGLFQGSRASSLVITPAAATITRVTTSGTQTVGIASNGTINTFGPNANIIAQVTTGSNTATIVSSYTDGNLLIDNEIQLASNASGNYLKDWNNTLQDYSTFMFIAPNDGATIPIPQFIRSLAVTGSLAVSGSNTLIGTKTITGSVFISGSKTIIGTNTITGSFITTGSFTLTGSAHGNVVSMSIVSSTASMDLNSGNYFTLSIPTGTTRISTSNIQAGTTATLVITTASGSLVTFDSAVKQPSGSAYIPTSGSVDVLSFASVNSSNLYVVSTKNMI